MTDLVDLSELSEEATLPPAEPAATGSRRRGRLLRRAAMRPRRVVVTLHRWLSLGLFVWLIVLATSGAWLVVHHEVERNVLHRDRYHHSAGDVGPEAAQAAAQKALPKTASIYGMALPGNGGGVYQVGAEVDHPAPKGSPEDAPPVADPSYYTAFVDPGSGRVNAVVDEAAGLTQWLYRGHMYLWQDQGLLGSFDAQTGWCRADASGHEPGGVKGVVCDVVPAGDDMVAWFAMGFIVVLLTGFYLWYWPGVHRWANALIVRRGRGRFSFHLSLHKAIGLVVWAPLLVVAFTGAAFAFPNMKAWYENATPAHRGFDLWETPEDLASGKAAGREPIGLDAAAKLISSRYPQRGLDYLSAPSDDTGTYTAWQTRGFDPWTREGGAGNVYVAIDQYSGRTLYDGLPGDGNVFDQAWDDWSFPLHTGDWGSTPTRVAWVALGVSPLVLGGTGITMQLVRRRKRHHAARGADATA